MTASLAQPHLSDEDARTSPFPGLVPYSLADADYFFGRDRWSDVVIDNLLAYRLSIFYGASGIGKSSVLSAGVLHRLLEQARDNLGRYDEPELAVAIFRAWTDDPAPGLKLALAKAVESISPELAADPPEGSLAEVLDAWSERVGGPVLVVLDQFEEYFVYHPRTEDNSGFDAELAQAIARRDLQANFLISIREDALAGLDRFEPLLPDLLANLVRIEHLDFDDARDVIEKAVDRWGSDHGEKLQIEEGLIQRVLEEVQTDRVFIGQTGRGITAAATESGSGSIEAPYLQLVMTRLWEEDRRTHSPALRLATLESLGGVKSIIETHLDQTMNVLSADDRDVAARVFHYLVTPSGTKIAHSACDLAEYAGVDEEELEPVLARLAKPDVRVLRLVPPPQPDGTTRYEIFHDVLGAAVLDWRARYIRGRHVRYAVAAVFAVSAQALLLVVPAAFVALTLDRQGGGRAAWAVWAVFGFLWWGLGTVLLFRRRRRRALRIWVIPVYSFLAICLGPFTLVPLGIRVVRGRRGLD